MYLISDGEFGAISDEYRLVRAARYLHTTPWELEDRDDWWLERALMYEWAEHEAQRKKS